MIKLPPYNTDAEDNVLGSLLIDGSLISQVTLSPSDFYNEANQWIFAACKSLQERNVSVNQITVAQELSEKKKLEAVGGCANLSQLIANCMSPLDCLYYADIVKRLSIYRQMITVSENISKIAHAQQPDVTDSLNKADELLLSLRKHGTSSVVVTPNERAKMMSDRYEKLYNRCEVALPTKVKDLDRQLGGGLFAGEMIIVGARPGMGKTSFLMNIANNVADNHKVLMCSAEMPVDAISDRDIAAALGLTISQIRCGGYSSEVYCDITGKGLDAINQRQVYFYHESPMTTAKILQTGLNMQLRYGLDLIIVDHMGLMDDMPTASRYEKISYVSRKLKQIAMKLNVPVLVATQLNRALEAREDKRPHLADLRDSGGIEEDADGVWFLYRDSYYTNTMDDTTEILIAKQRQGEANKIVKVFYDRKHQTYRELTYRSEL